MLVIELDRLPTHQGAEIFRQCLVGRHGRAIEQDRYDANVACQRGAGFEADEVVRVVEPAAAAGVGGR